MNIEFSTMCSLINTKTMNPMQVKSAIEYMVSTAYDNDIDINFRWSPSDRNGMFEISLYGRNTALDSWLTNVMCMDRPEMARTKDDWSQGYSGTVPIPKNLF